MNMYIVLLFVGLLVLTALIVMVRSSRKTWSVEEAKGYLDSYFTKMLNSSLDQTGIQVLIESKGFAYSFAAGTMSALNGMPIARDQPFHAASIGKMFTAVLIMKLAERGKLSIDDPIVNYLPQSELNNLFLFENVDYAEHVTIKNLLGHTSGIADYFADPVIDPPSFMERIVSNFNQFWTPQQLIEFTRTNQRPVGIPGTLFHYSDTGYILLGQIIERITGSSLSEKLHHKIWGPLKMNDSYLMFYSEPKNGPKPIQDIWLHGVEVSRYPSLSCDWAGGGIVTTPQDLILFQKALMSGTCITASSLQQMESFAAKFRAGIHYGLGMMEIRFEEFFPLLKGLPRLRGHIGVVAAHMFCHRDSDTCIIMNFGSSSAMVRSFRALIKIVFILKKMRFL